MPDEPPITQQAQGSYIAQATHGGTATVQVVLPPAPVQEQNRVRFLKRLRYRYDEQWEQSLEGASLLTLGLVSKPDAVLHHTGLLFLSPQQPERPLPPGTSIAQVYEQAGQELLILGEPGAGKSTLLLDLARRLVERAEQDAAQPFPVIIPLSTWAVKRQPLTDWLSEQLTQLYDVPRRLSYSWVQTDQLLLLLDGFDEVPQEARVACIKAIAAYREEHLVPIVVCSRRTEFEEIPRQQRLAMQSAVVVQPLTQEQVEDYLLQGGEALTAVRTVLHSNPVLQELISTPLMLHILTLTYAGSKARDLPQGGSPEEQQRIIFARYTEHMIERRRNRISFPLQRIIPYLSWLARQMQHHSQTMFYLEQLQPSWLTTRWGSHFFTLGSIWFPGIVIGCIVSLILELFLTGYSGREELLLQVLLGGLLGGLLSSKQIPFSVQYHRNTRLHLLITSGTAVILGLGFGFLELLLFRRAGWSLSVSCIAGVCIGSTVLILTLLLMMETQHSFQRRVRLVLSGGMRGYMWPRVLMNIHLRYGILIGGLWGLSWGLRIWIDNVARWGVNGAAHEGALIYGTRYALINGLIYGITATMLSFFFTGKSSQITPTEILTWSWRSLQQSLVMKNHIKSTFRIGLVAFLIFGLSSGLGEFLARCLVIWVNYGLGGVFDNLGFSLEGLNYGLGDGLGGGLSIGLGYWLLIGLFQGVSSDHFQEQQRIIPNQGIFRSILNGILLGLIGGSICTILVALSRQLNFLLSGVVFDLLVNKRLYSDYVLSFSLSDYAIVIVIGVAAGLLVAILRGGLAWWRHWMLRLLLWPEGAIPWPYIRFLDEAAGCILLRKVGGGYMFMHRLILDYFASLDNPVTKPELPQPSQAAPPKVCSACGYQEERPGARFCAGCGKSLAS